MTLRRNPIVIALVAAAMAFVIANALEESLVRAVRPTALTLEWISDAFLAVAFSVASYLWLHLRLARKDLTRLEREKLVIDTQLHLAAQIQRGLLPDVPPPRGGWRFAARIELAGLVGGDFFDFVEVPEQGMLVLLADVSGKGIPAALFLGVLRTLFRSYAQQTSEPRALAARMSEALHQQSGGTPYVTAVICRIGRSNAALDCVNAGHPAGLVLGGRTPRLLATGGPPLGLLPSACYESETVMVSPGEFVVLLSDGISEAVESDTQSAHEVVRQAVAALLPRARVDDLADEVMRMGRVGGRPAGIEGWEDDRTVVVLGRVEVP